MSTQARSVPFLDVLDPEFDFDSAEVAAARERNWYADSPMGPMVLRHREAEDLLHDHRFKLGGAAFMEFHGIADGPLYDWWTRALMSLDPPDHARLRGLLNKAFTPRVVEGLRPFTRATADRLAARIGDSGECEFVSAFSDPLPALVMCELLGVPPGDYPEFHRWTADIGLAFSRADLTGARLSRVNAAVAAMIEYIGGLITARRQSPGADVLTAMIAAQEGGDSMSFEELHNLALLLVWAGQDTTARQLGRALVAFAAHPDQWNLLAHRPDLLPQAVEEVCRWSPQARVTWRYALRDVEYQGLRIPAGTQVTSCNVPANRDPRAFADPDRFDITVTRRSRQLAFGGGVYYCLGTSLARLELAEALAALTSRFGPPTITGPIIWRPPMAVIHGPDVLPLRFPPRAEPGT